MKTAVIYSRVSTTLQDAESQNKELIEYARKNEYQLLAEPFTETISGITKADSRKQFNNLKTFVETNKPSHLLLWEISRLGRDTENILHTIKYFTELKICIYLKKENLFTLNDDGKLNYHVELVLTMMGAIGSMERRTTMERSIRGLRDASMKGHWLGGRNLPYGYKRIEDGKMLVVDEEEAEIVKEIYDMYLNGKGTYIIANELNKRKIPTRFNKAYTNEVKTRAFPKQPSDFKFAPNTIYHILKNQIYIGKRKFKDEWFESPTIISPEVFSSVGERLTHNFNKMDNNTTNFYLLGGIKNIKCGECGKNYYPNKTKSSNQYVCFSSREKPKCKNNGINIDKFTYSVWYVLRDEDVLKKHIENSLLERDINKEIENKELVFIELEKQFKNVDKNENFLLDRVMEGLISKENYDLRIVKVLEERKSLVEKIENTKNELNELKTYRDLSSDFNSQIREIKGDKQKMKEVITKIIKKITINPVKNRIEDMLGGLQDKMICVDVLLHNTPKPITYIITQRTQNIMILKDGEYDYENKMVFITSKDIEKRKWGLHRDVDKKYLTQF